MKGREGGGEAGGGEAARVEKRDDGRTRRGVVGISTGIWGRGREGTQRKVLGMRTGVAGGVRGPDKGGLDTDTSGLPTKRGPRVRVRVRVRVLTVLMPWYWYWYRRRS